jgi:hypothetical protein
MDTRLVFCSRSVRHVAVRLCSMKAFWGFLAVSKKNIHQKFWTILTFDWLKTPHFLLECAYRARLFLSYSVWKTGLSPQTCSKPAENRVYQHENLRNSTKLGTRSVYDRFISGFRSIRTETVYRFCPNLHKPTRKNSVLSSFRQVFLSKTRFSAGLEQVWRDKPVFQTESDFCNIP